MAWLKNSWGSVLTILRDNYLQIILLLIFSILVSLLYPSGRSFKYTDLHVGDISPLAIEAPVDFEVLKSDDQIRRDREAIRLSINPVFSARDTLAAHYRTVMERLFDSLLDTTAAEWVVPPPLALDMTGVDEMDYAAIERLSLALQRVLNGVAGQFIISPEDLVRVEDFERINVARGAIERVVPHGSLISTARLSTQIVERLEKHYPQLEQPVGYRVGVEILRQLLGPNIVYNRAETERLVQEAIDRVPIAHGYVRSGELIVDRHERITPEAMGKIRSLGRKLATRQQSNGNDDWSLLGRLLLTLVFVGLMTVYLYVFRPAIFSDLRQMPALLTVLLLILAVVRLEFNYDLGVYVTPIPLLAILLTLIFDLRISFFLLILMTLLAGSIYGNDFTYLLVAVVTGICAAWTVRNLQRHRRLLVTSLVILIVFVITNFGLKLANFTLSGTEKQELLYATITAAATPLAALFLLWLLRLIFGVTNNLQLIKLARIEHPLLRKLALAAPGTFKLTVQVGSLAETAAREIGANPLLSRAGAYFRDLGKTLNAEVFRENRGKLLDPPVLELAPVIRKHLQAGVAIARQHHLPIALIDIIRQHHGASRLDHLLERAHSETDSADIRTAEFRYPGELPQTPESSIVMLADAVGGAVFSQGVTTREEVDQLVGIVIQEKVNAGQLDRSSLTISNLRGVRDAFVEQLSEQSESTPPAGEA